MSQLSELFPDTGLGLAVLDALLSAGRLTAARIDEALEGIAAKSYGLDPREQPIEIESQRAKEALGRLAELDVDESALAEIPALDFDGGNEIYMLLEDSIDIDTGGEEDWYQLESLAGVERLTGLQSIDLDGHGYRDAPLDLTPLANHPSLADVRLSGACTATATLETLSKLASLNTDLATLDDATAIERLAKRGLS